MELWLIKCGLRRTLVCTEYGVELSRFMAVKDKAGDRDHVEQIVRHIGPSFLCSPSWPRNLLNC